LPSSTKKSRNQIHCYLTITKKEAIAPFCGKLSQKQGHEQVPFLFLLKPNQKPWALTASASFVTRGSLVPVPAP
jgi:hypothetical protein